MDKYSSFFILLFLFSLKIFGMEPAGGQEVSADDYVGARGCNVRSRVVIECLAPGFVALRLLKPVQFRGEAFSPDTEGCDLERLFGQFGYNVAGMIKGLGLVRVQGQNDASLEVVDPCDDGVTASYYSRGRRR